MLETVAEVGMKAEKLLIEVEMLMKQIWPVGGVQQDSGLSEIMDFLHDERGMWTRLEGRLLPCPDPYTFSARGSKLLPKARGMEEQVAVQGQQVSA